MEPRITSEPWKTWGTWCSRMTWWPYITYRSRWTLWARLAHKSFVTFYAFYMTPWRSRGTWITWISS